MHTDPEAEEKGTHGSIAPEGSIVPLWALPPTT